MRKEGREEGREGGRANLPSVCGKAVDVVCPLALEQVHGGGQRLARVQKVVHDDAGATAREGGREGGKVGRESGY
jgi:hypothetical protein